MSTLDWQEYAKQLMNLPPAEKALAISKLKAEFPLDSPHPMYTDFRASMLDLSRALNGMIASLNDPQQWRGSELASLQEGFCLGNWRIVPRSPENTPSESPEASWMEFDAWWDDYYGVDGNVSLEIALRGIASDAWQASRAQLNSPSTQ